MEPRIATGYEKLAIELEQHMRYKYIPSGWRYPISNVASVPFFLPTEGELLMKAHKEGTLTERLDELSKANEISDNYSAESSLKRKIKPGYVREAIIDFFNKGYEL